MTGCLCGSTGRVSVLNDPPDGYVKGLVACTCPSGEPYRLPRNASAILNAEVERDNVRRTLASALAVGPDDWWPARLRARIAALDVEIAVLRADALIPDDESDWLRDLYTADTDEGGVGAIAALELGDVA